jgi:hypothetical protein
VSYDKELHVRTSLKNIDDVLRKEAEGLGKEVNSVPTLLAIIANPMPTVTQSNATATILESKVA